MKVKNYLRFAALAIGVFALAQFAQAQSDVRICNMTAGAGSVRWDLIGYDSGGSITISFPDSRSFTKEFKGSSVQFDLTDQKLNGVPDGVYNWEMRVSQSFTPPGQSFTPPGMRHANVNARKDDEPEGDRAGRKPAALPPLVQSGTFAIVNGNVIGPGTNEGPQDVARRTKLQQLKTPPATSSRVSENTITRLRNHRFSLLARPDVVTADDEIIQGSLCVGLDCVNNESFGFDTIRLKENNTRIKFDDTSTAAGFPANDWQLTANDSNSGGASKFSIEDITGAKVPFTITAGAPTNSLFVSSSGKIGARTSTPVLDFHISTTDTPAIRQEQTSGGGFTAQTWDIGANEANWFVRDVTGGSRLPLRIRPGAPTSSIDIAASGKVGVGTASPGQMLHVFNSGNVYAQIESSNTGAAGAIYRRSGSSDWLVGQGAASANANFETFSSGSADATWNMNGSERLRILGSNGNVGIGTAAPDQKLSIQGDADKSAGGTTWGVFSDERLKDIKGGYTRGLSAVMGLRPVRFSYKKDNALALQSDTEIIGFSAQALQRVVPEAVSNSANGYLVVHSDPILWAMVNAIQEQQKEIAALKGQIQKLKTTVHRRRR